MFPAGVCKVAEPFAGVAIFYECINDRVHDELLVVEFGPGNISGIGRGSGWILGWLCGFQVGEVRR